MRRGDPLSVLLAGAALLTAPVWVLALRGSLPELLGLSWAAPDALGAALAAAAWQHRPSVAVLFALALGLLLEAPGSLPFGVHVVRLTVLVALFASLRPAVAVEVPGGSLLVGAAFCLCERALAGLTAELGLGLEPGTLLPQALATAGLSIPLAPLAFAVSSTLLSGLGEEPA